MSLIIKAKGRGIEPRPITSFLRLGSNRVSDKQRWIRLRDGEFSGARRRIAARTCRAVFVQPVDPAGRTLTFAGENRENPTNDVCQLLFDFVLTSRIIDVFHVVENCFAQFFDFLPHVVEGAARRILRVQCLQHRLDLDDGLGLDLPSVEDFSFSLISLFAHTDNFSAIGAATGIAQGDFPIGIDLESVGNRHRPGQRGGKGRPDQICFSLLEKLAGDTCIAPDFSDQVFGGVVDLVDLLVHPDDHANEVAERPNVKVGGIWLLYHWKGLWLEVVETTTNLIFLGLRVNYLNNLTKTTS